jgi:hypothetical protein
MTPKQRYFKRVYDEAPMIDCACGCGTSIKSVDKYARPKTFISGHNGRKYEDPTQHKREWNHRNRLARYTYKKQYYYTRKRKLMALFGNKCLDCGIEYNGKNAAIFHFHHYIEGKEFNIGSILINKAWKTVLKEAELCQLLCANCHEMKHSVEF